MQDAACECIVIAIFAGSASFLFLALGVALIIAMLKK